MHDTLTAVNNSTVSGLGRLAGFFGFNDVMGRLYGTLLLNPEPLSLDELCDTLQISKGSVSMNMRDLERWGMAKEVWVRGERRKFYKAESDMWQVIRNADMTIVATDTEAALAQIAQMAENGGGWVVSSNVYQSSETSQTGYIQIRIPSEGFQSVLDAIAGMSVRVDCLLYTSRCV